MWCDEDLNASLPHAVLIIPKGTWITRLYVFVEGTSIHIQFLNENATQLNPTCPNHANPQSVKSLHYANRASDTWQTISTLGKTNMFALKMDLSKTILSFLRRPMFGDYALFREGITQAAFYQMFFIKAQVRIQPYSDSRAIHINIVETSQNIWEHFRKPPLQN